MANSTGFPGADAWAMAAAILGPGARILKAAFRGDAAASGLDDRDGALLSTGDGRQASDVSSIDIEFIPESDRLNLDMVLKVEDVPIRDADRLLADGVSITINGEPSGLRARAALPFADGGSERDTATPIAPEGIEFGMKAVIGVMRRHANTLRIATGAIGGGLVLSSLAVRAEAEPGNGEAVGNPSTGNNGNVDGVGNAGGAPGGGNGGGTGNGNQNLLVNDDTYDMTPNSTITVDLTANDLSPGNSFVFVTQINGVDIASGETIVLASGEQITLNEDGTVTIVGDADPATQFEYTAAIGAGNSALTDTGLVTINTIPCFTSGTMIRTGDGDVPVEDLRLGQLVMTRDDGLQPIRWIGRRTLPAEGPMAPVAIQANTFGVHAKLMVSPLHRILIRNVHAELLFGHHEVLIAARDLIDGRAVTRVEGGFVQYVHLLFDRHHVVWSNGLQSESFLPGPQTAHCFEAQAIREIAGIFPALDPLTGAGYGPAARPTLAHFEARLLVA